MKITDGTAKMALALYEKQVELKGYKESAMKAALDAVFNHIADDGKMVVKEKCGCGQSGNIPGIVDIKICGKHLDVITPYTLKSSYPAPMTHQVFKGVAGTAIKEPKNQTSLEQKRRAAELTKLEHKMLDYIEEYIENNEGRSPLLRQIGDNCGVNSLGTIHRYINAIIAKGFMEKGASGFIIVLGSVAGSAGVEPEQPTDTQDNDGWIEWKGGKQPVNGDTIVEIRFRDGTKQKSKAANYRWYRPADYTHHIRSLDIIAYRIIEEPKAHTHISPLAYEGCNICNSKKEPSRQTLAEFLSEKDVFSNKLTAIGLACYLSEYMEKNK